MLISLCGQCRSTTSDVGSVYVENVEGRYLAFLPLRYTPVLL